MVFIFAHNKIKGCCHTTLHYEVAATTAVIFTLTNLEAITAGVIMQQKPTIRIC